MMTNETLSSYKIIKFTTECILKIVFGNNSAASCPISMKVCMHVKADIAWQFLKLTTDGRHFENR